MNINPKLMILDHVVVYNCITKNNTKTQYSFNRWKTDSNERDIKSMVDKANKESEKTEKKFIDSLNKLGWKFECTIKKVNNDE